MRYLGWYSTRCRGERARAAAPAVTDQTLDEAAVIAPHARSAWARLIHKVYEVDPLECRKCKGPMQVIALIEDAEVIRRILEHLGRWAPRGKPRGPPVTRHDSAEPVQASCELTYHPVPDIA